MILTSAKFTDNKNLQGRRGFVKHGHVGFPQCLLPINMHAKMTTIMDKHESYLVDHWF